MMAKTNTIMSMPAYSKRTYSAQIPRPTPMPDPPKAYVRRVHGKIVELSMQRRAERKAGNGRGWSRASGMDIINCQSAGLTLPEPCLAYVVVYKMMGQ